jgi:hypothetical protein
MANLKEHQQCLDQGSTSKFKLQLKLKGRAKPTPTNKAFKMTDGMWTEKIFFHPIPVP